MRDLAKWVDSHDIDVNNASNLEAWLDECMAERNEVVKQLDSSKEVQANLRVELNEVHSRMRFLNSFLANIQKTA